MIFYELYSDRNSNIDNDIFIYDKVTPQFKNTILYFMQKNLSIQEFVELYRDMISHHGIRRNISETYLTSPTTFQDKFISGFERLVDEQDDINFYLRSIELFLKKINNNKIDIIISLNRILYKYSLGYQVDELQSQIIRVDSKYIYQTTTKKALLILNDIKFKNVDDEYRKAYEEFKNSNYESVLVEANKAFESTMKIICELKEYGLPKSHNASALIAYLKKNDFIENFQTEKFNGLTKTLESVSIMRNNQAGHGQGSEKRDLSIFYAEYALNVTASTILLLVGMYNESI